MSLSFLTCKIWKIITLTIISSIIVATTMVLLPGLCKLLCVGIWCNIVISLAVFLLTMWSPTVLLEFMYLISDLFIEVWRTVSYFKHSSGYLLAWVVFPFDLNFTPGFSDWYSDPSYLPLPIISCVLINISYRFFVSWRQTLICCVSQFLWSKYSQRWLTPSYQQDIIW